MRAKLINKRIEHITEYKISEEPTISFDIKTGKYDIIFYNIKRISHINTIEEQKWIDVYDAIIGGKLLYKANSDNYKHITNISIKSNYLEIETEEHLYNEDKETQWYIAKEKIRDKLVKIKKYKYIERIKHIYKKLSTYQNVYFYNKNFRIYTEDVKASLGMEQIILDIIYNYTIGKDYINKLTPLDKYIIFRVYKLNFF